MNMKVGLKSPHTCPACESVGTVKPMPMNSINVVHRENGQILNAWDDVTGNELDPKLTIKACDEEMEQFKKAQSL